MSTSANQIALYIQKELYDGKQPDVDGYYRFSRTDLAENTRISLSTLNRCISETVELFSNWYNFSRWAKFNPDEYGNEQLFINVEYKRGVFQFQRNPLTLNEQFSFLWGLPPLSVEYFTFDFFDEKHRRRINGDVMIHDAIPWQWDADQYEDQLNKAREEIKAHQMQVKDKHNISLESQRIEHIKKVGGLSLKKYSENDITFDMCVAALEDDVRAFDYIPQKYLCERIYKIACQKKGSILAKTPDEFKTEDVCWCAVESEPHSILFVPKKLQTRELWLNAVCGDPVILESVPPKLIDQSLFSIAINNEGLAWFQLVPKEYKSTELISSLIQKYPNLIYFIPQKQRSASLCNKAIAGFGYHTIVEAINDNPILFTMFPTSLHTHETCKAFICSSFCQIALAQKNDPRFGDIDIENGVVTIPQESELLSQILFPAFRPSETYFLEYISTQRISFKLKDLLQWEDVCEQVLKINGRFLEDIPNNLISYNLCKIAVQNDGFALRYVPKEYMTEELCLIAVNHDPFAIGFIPETIITQEMCLAAVKGSGYVLRYIPKYLLTHELCKIALEDRPDGIKYVPSELIDNELTQLSLETYRMERLLSHIPIDKRTYAVCLKAVNHDGRELEYVPDEFKTHDMCLAAVMNNSWAVIHIPSDMLSEDICKVVARDPGSFNRIPKIS